MKFDKKKPRRVTAVLINVIFLFFFFWQPNLVDWDETQVMIRHQYVILLGSILSAILLVSQQMTSPNKRQSKKSHVVHLTFWPSDLKGTNFAVKFGPSERCIRGFLSYYFKTWQKYVFYNVLLENRKTIFVSYAY